MSSLLIIPVELLRYGDFIFLHDAVCNGYVDSHVAGYVYFSMWATGLLQAGRAFRVVKGFMRTNCVQHPVLRPERGTKWQERKTTRRR